MSKGTERDVMHELAHDSRLIGAVHGTAMFLVTSFIGAITSQVAMTLAVHNSAVTGANTAGGFFGSLLALTLIIRRRGVPRKWVTVGYFVSASVGAVLVATAGLAFPREGIWFVYAGLGMASLALVALTPIRPAVAARFNGDKRDGTFTSRSRAWSYGTIGVLVLTVGGITASPLGWRVAVGLLAVWIGVCAVMLARFRHFPEPTPVGKRIEPWALLDTFRFARQRWMIIAVGSAGFIAQLVYVSLEPYLSAPSLLGRLAPAYVGAALGLIKIAIVPIILRQGALSDDRVHRAAMRAARSLAAGAALALVTFSSHDLIILFAPLLAAMVLVELGNGPMADAARTQGSRLSLEADAMSTVSSQFSYDVAGVVATVAQLPSVIDGAQRLMRSSTFGLLTSVSAWDIVLIAWLIVAAYVLRTTHKTDWRPDPQGRIWAERGTAQLRVKVGLYEGTLAAFRVVMSLRGGPEKSVHVTDGAKYTVRVMLDGRSQHPLIPSSVIWFGVTRPRLQRRQAGRLFPLALYPIVARNPNTKDYLRTGFGLWLGRPGTWTIEDGETVCRSLELARPVEGNLFVHNS